MDAILRTHDPACRADGRGRTCSRLGADADAVGSSRTRERPLYGQRRPDAARPASAEDIAAYVVERFYRHRVAASATRRRAAAGCQPKGIPERRDAPGAPPLWHAFGTGEAATAERLVHAALEDALTELEPEFEARWQRLSVVEQKTSRAVIAGEGSPLSCAGAAAPRPPQDAVPSRRSATPGRPRGGRERLSAAMRSSTRCSRAGSAGSPATRSAARSQRVDGQPQRLDFVLEPLDPRLQLLGCGRRARRRARRPSPAGLSRRAAVRSALPSGPGGGPAGRQARARAAGRAPPRRPPARRSE